MDINIEDSDSRRIDWLYMQSGRSAAKAPKIRYDSDQVKLMVATHYHTGTGTLKDKWVIDWKNIFKLDTKERAAEWELRRKRFDPNDSARAKTRLPDYEPFDDLEPEWYNVTLSDYDNVINIYNTYGKIVHRDHIAALGKTRKALRTSTTYNDKALESIIAQSKRLDTISLQKLINWALQASANKTTKKHYFGAPDWMQKYFKALLKNFSENGSGRHITSHHIKFAEFCMLGAMPCSYDAHNDSQGDISHFTPEDVYDLNDYFDEIMPNDTSKISVSIQDYNPLKKITKLQSKDIQYLDRPAKTRAVRVAMADGIHAFDNKKLKTLLIQSWNAHNEEITKWLLNEDNFQLYHIFRRSRNHTWEFNYLAICASIKKDLNITFNPLTLQWILHKFPEKLEGSIILDKEAPIRILDAKNK